MEVLLPAFLKPLVNLDEAINTLLAILLFPTALCFFDSP